MGKQKRSPNTYQKINTIFMRDANNIIMPYDEFTEPEFEYLRHNKWQASEKIDGTNVRIEVTKCSIFSPGNESMVGVGFEVTFKGKTDNAQIPKNLLKHMEEKYPKNKVLAALGLKEYIPVEEWETEHNWLEYDQIPNIYTIYGEGYGEGIQSGGWYIKGGNEFIVFDVKVNDIYLKTDARDEIANKLGAPIVPLIGYFTLDEAIDFVRKGFKTGLWDNKDFIEEGLVLRTDLGLRNRMGKRLIVKVKYEDFRKYRNVYGTDEKVDQPKNEKYTR